MSADPPPVDKKPFPSTESDPLLPHTGPSTAVPNPDRPRTVRHHRRTLSGRSIRAGHFQFGPSFHPNIYPAVNDPFSRQAQRVADGRARSRFFKALFAGLGLWIIVGLVLGWTGLQQSGWGRGNHRVDYGAKPSVPRADGRPVACAKFASSGFVSSNMPGATTRSVARLGFPLADHAAFFVHGRGSFAKGRIELGRAKGGRVEVEVEALYNDEALIDLMTVCHVEGREQTQAASNPTDSVGLGIYTPSPEVGPYPDSDLEFRIRILLPSSLASLSSFEVSGALFAIESADLSTIALGRLDVSTTVGPIFLRKTHCEFGKVQTNNGHIEGSFEVSKALSLATTNGAITAEIVLLSDTSRNRNATHTPVAVDATTTNGAVSVRYLTDPGDVRLSSYVSSTNGRAEVRHPPMFEGAFEVETTWGSVETKGPFTDRDPSGKNRMRHIAIDSDQDELGYKHIAGTVWWGKLEEKEKKREFEKSVVRTTLGSVRVIFD